MNFKLLLIVLLLLPLSLKAQIGEQRSTLSVGGNAGITLSSIDFDPTIRQKQLIQPTLGLTLRYTCEKYFSTVCAIQAELNLARLGWKEDIMNGEKQKLPDTYQRELTYLQFPLMARLAWGKEQRGLMFFVLAGPQVNFYLGQSEKRSDVWTLNQNGNPDRPNNVYQQYTMDPQHKFDYGLTGGLGAELNTGIGHFMLEGRYYFGLADLYKNSKKDVFSRSAHRVIAVKATYLFDLTKSGN
jgi:hypothetical protein